MLAEFDAESIVLEPEGETKTVPHSADEQRFLELLAIHPLQPQLFTLPMLRKSYRSEPADRFRSDERVSGNAPAVNVQVVAWLEKGLGISLSDRWALPSSLLEHEINPAGTDAAFDPCCVRPVLDIACEARALKLVDGCKK
jgi:hypothetical protein